MPKMLFIIRQLVLSSVFSVLFLQVLSAQTTTPDTLILKVSEAENLFLKNNFQLILKRYDISTAQAEIITAGLFDNPEMSYENVFYNPDTRKFLQTSIADGQGQYQAQLSQLFKLAGKRNKAVKLAQSGVKLAEYEFFDLMRTLRFSLKSTFNDLYYAQQSAGVFGREISSLQKTLKAFEQQYAKGNISAKEVLRIKSLLYTLQGEEHELLGRIDSTATNLKQLTLIPAGTYIKPVIEAGKNPVSVARYPFQQLLDSAYQHRADFQLAKAGTAYAAQNLSLQKALAVPDITVSATYDLQGNHIKNYNGIGISMPIPFFNRNQGGIKQARIAIDAGKTALDLQQNILQNEVAESYRAAIRIEKLYAGFDPDFAADFDRMVEEVSRNYFKRNIGLLEFIDFYESYKENTLRMNLLRNELFNSREALNYVTGTPLF